MVYSILYEGHWPVIRDYVNILDKKNWDLFGIYTLIVWTLSLIIIPGIIYLLSYTGMRLSNAEHNAREVFITSTGSLLPLGLMLWIAFVIPMLFVNLTFVVQSVSDPFGWGWDFFGTANIPWHQFLPKLVPWLQSVLVLTGLWISLRNLKRSWQNYHFKSKNLFMITMPMALFITAIAVVMIFFYTN
jgi:hypothetical protein